MERHGKVKLFINIAKLNATTILIWKVSTKGRCEHIHKGNRKVRANRQRNRGLKGGSKDSLLLHPQMIHFVRLFKLLELLIIQSIGLVKDCPFQSDLIYLHCFKKPFWIIHIIHLLKSKSHIPIKSNQTQK